MITFIQTLKIPIPRWPAPVWSGHVGKPSREGSKAFQVLSKAIFSQQLYPRRPSWVPTFRSHDGSKLKPREAGRSPARGLGLGVKGLAPCSLVRGWGAGPKCLEVPPRGKAKTQGVFPSTRPSASTPPLPTGTKTLCCRGNCHF